ncbi:MAG: hypothetical protein AB9866_17090 [Syntrophobacteraceae bacterium]
MLAAGYRVLVETNGSIDIDRVDRGCARIMDIKCPSSGMDGHNNMMNLSRLTERDELKFVLGSREDYEFAKNTLAAHPGGRCMVNFSPVFGRLAARSLAGWILEDRLAVRLNLQIHKVIWEPDARGV